MKEEHFNEVTIITDIINHQYIIKYKNLERIVSFFDMNKDYQLGFIIADEMKAELRDEKIKKLLNKDDKNLLNLT